LRQAHKKRRKKYGSKDKRGQLCNRVSIDQRPDIVDEKSRIGDWEIDTVMGQNHKGALVTIVERKSNYFAQLIFQIFLLLHHLSLLLDCPIV
jgi:IS30 family transposase